MSIWPRVVGRTPEERQAIRTKDMERRLDNLERNKANQIQKGFVTLTGSPLVGGISSSTKTEISNSGIEVQVPETTNIVLVSVAAQCDVTTAASATLRIGVFESTDFSITNSQPLVEWTATSSDSAGWVFTGFPVSNLFPTAGPPPFPGSSRQGAAFQNPYWSGDAGLVAPTAGTRNYRLSYWRQAGSGTARILDIRYALLVF
jgi:hypothetical protein